jgi:hypothetical protein
LCSAPAEADAELEFASCADGFPVGEDGDSVAFLCGRGSRAGGVLLAFGVASSALVLVVPDAEGVVVGFASAGAATAVLLSPVVGSGTASCDSPSAAWVAILVECGWGATDFVVGSPPAVAMRADGVSAVAVITAAEGSAYTAIGFPTGRMLAPVGVPGLTFRA